MSEMASLPPIPDAAWPPLPPPPPWPDPRRRRGKARIAFVLAALLAVSGAGVALVAAESPRGEFRFLGRTAAGDPERWNPCEPIHYVANLDSAPSGGLTDLQDAVQRISDATGIEFVYDGQSHLTVEDQFEWLVPSVSGIRWLPMLVIWLPRGEFERYESRPDVLAFAYPEPGGGDLVGQYVSGIIVVKSQPNPQPAFLSALSPELVLMHELGHIVGLDHVDDPNEVMFESDTVFGNRVDDWGPGDLEGLHDLGRSAGCLAAISTAPL